MMYDILRIPDKRAHINQHIANVYEFDDPPDFKEHFWTRRRGYAELGLFVSSVARRLRASASLPIENEGPSHWNRHEEMRKVIAEIDEDRAAWEKRQARQMADVGPPLGPADQSA
jgi:hypothetical protein